MTPQDILSEILIRFKDSVPQCGLVEAVRKAQTIIVNRLMLRRSPLLKSYMTATIASGDESFRLAPPSGKTFLALAGTPYLTADRTFLKPYDDALSVSATAGKPRYYEKAANRLHIYPVSDAEYDVTIPAFLAPAQVDMTEDLPFDGLLDDVFAEAIFGVMSLGSAAVADKTFTEVIGSQVDMALTASDIAEEQALVDSINYR